MNVSGPEPSSHELSACVVMPSYNNCATLRALVEGALESVGAAIVVNDGCTDGTAELLGGIAAPGLYVVTHSANRGKGAALLSGFRRARELGFTHAISMDTDGQHRPEDLPAMLEAMREHPDAHVVGVRRLSGGGRPLKSRILRAHSNLWVWLETGKWVADTQTGFRVWPLDAVLNLRLKTSKYDFEIESLVKLLWCGVPVETVPVEAGYGPGSKSHFRPLRDFALVFRLNAVLFSESLFVPKPVRKAVHTLGREDGQRERGILAWARRLLHDQTASPSRFASSIGVGVVFGILPIWGFQMAVAFLVAHLLRLSKPLVLVASNISFPGAMPFILYASLILGRLTLRGTFDFSLRPTDMTLQTVWTYAYEYVTGACVLAAAAGAVAGIGAYVLARLAVSLRRGAAS